MEEKEENKARRTSVNFTGMHEKVDTEEEEKGFQLSDSRHGFAAEPSPSTTRAAKGHVGRSMMRHKTSWIKGGMMQSAAKAVADQLERVEKHKQSFMGTDELGFHVGNTRVSNVQWLMALTLPNPDFNESLKSKSWDRNRAAKFFHDCFKGEDEEFQYQRETNHRYEKIAFMHCFDRLQEQEIIEEASNESQNSRHEELGDTRRKWANGATHFYNGYNWSAHKAQTNDFLTLVRNVIVTNLVQHLGLKVNLMFSHGGEFIYVLVAADEAIIANEAERSGYDVQMEMGASDLESMQPCDGHLRPFRILRQPQDIEDAEAELKEAYKRVFQGSDEKMMKLHGLNDSLEQDDDDADETEKLVPYKVSEQKWRTYKFYLEQVRDSLQHLTEAQIKDGTKCLLHKKILRKALQKANEEYPFHKLKTMWDRMGVKPMPAYTEFVRRYDDQTGQDQYKPYWQKHVIDKSGRRSIFKDVDRLKLVYNYITRTLDLNKLKLYGVIQDYFPLHNEWKLTGKDILMPASESRESLFVNKIMTWILYSEEVENEDENEAVGLKDKWSWSSVNQVIPLDSIKNYFGEKIGLKFAYQQMYTRFMSLIVAVGIVCFIGEVFIPNSWMNTFFAATFSCGIILWATVFVEKWKQTQFITSIKWGQVNFEEIEVMRPEFTGYPRRSPVDDNPQEIYFPHQKRQMLILAGVCVSILLLGVVIISVIGVLLLKANLSGHYIKWNLDWGRYLGSGILAVQIEIFNAIYSWVAMRMTEEENHKTQSQFDQSLIMKTFIFQFVNSYNLLIYIAFFKTNVEGCIVYEDDGTWALVNGASCLGELRIQLAFIFILHTIRRLAQATIPWLQAKFTKRRAVAATDHPSPRSSDVKELFRNRLDKQAYQGSYTFKGVDGTFQDYLEMMVQYGFITLFAACFPLAPFICFLNNIWESKLDRFKLMYVLKRPLPQPANGIGQWLWVLESITDLAIVSNAAILCFTLKVFEEIDVFGNNELVAFIFVITAAWFIRKIATLVFVREPEQYKEIVKRHKYIVDKCIKGFAPIKKAKEGHTEEFNLHIQ